MKIIMLIETYNNSGIRYSGFNKHIPLTWIRRYDIPGVLWWVVDDNDGVLYYTQPNNTTGKLNQKLSKLPRLQKIFVS